MSVNPESMLLTKAERAFPMRTAKKAGGLRLCEIGVAASLCCMLCNSATGQAAARASTSQERPSYWGLWGELNLRYHFNASVLNVLKLSCSLFQCLRFLGYATLLVLCTHRKKTTSKILGWNLTSPRAKVRAEARIKQQSRRQRQRPRALMWKATQFAELWRVVKSLLGFARSKSEPVDTVAAAAQVAAKMQAGNLPEGKRCDMCFQLFTYITTAVEMSILCHPPFSLFYFVS